MKAATSTSFSSKKRPSPLDRSPASTTAGSGTSSVSMASRSRSSRSPNPQQHSPSRRLAPDCPTSTFSLSSSPTSGSTSTSAASAFAAAAAPAVPAASSSSSSSSALPLTKEQKQKQAAYDSQMISLFELEYREDVIEYMYEMESQTIASVELIDMQPELAWYMRPYLVDFLIEIHQQYRLRPETLYLAINIVDRYVSKRIVYKKHYQLVGCAALWIASKFEDAKDRVPTVEDLCAVCCSAYDQSAFIQMEGHVLSTIGWCLGHPTAEAWLRIACTPGPFATMEDTRTQHVARFLMELTLFHRAFVSIKPSDIALSCLLLARFICDPEKARRSNERAEVVKIAQMLDAHLAEHLEQVSATVVKKYSPSFYSRASTYVREWYLSGHRFNAQQLVHPSASSSAPEIDMTTSSPTSSRAGSANGGDSDFDDEYDEEGTSFTSEPLTPSTSVASSACGDLSSDPFESSTARGQQARQHAAYYAPKALPLAVPALKMQQQQPSQQPQQPQLPLPTPSAGMQWAMQVVPPSTE